MKKTLLLLALLVALINSQCDVPGCETCPSGTGTCTVCSQGLGYLPTPYATPPPVCDCRTGFYWDTDESKCLACDNKFKNCEQCDMSGCTKCLDDAQNVSNICVQVCQSIFAGCSACNGLTCTACDEKRNLTMNGNVCNCKPGFIRKRDLDDFCLPCSYFTPGCETCSAVTDSPFNDITCDTCKVQASMLPTTCACRPGYYLVPKTVYHLDSECMDCKTFDSKCTACTGYQACTSCEGFSNYLSGGRCPACSMAHSNCVNCNPSNGDCTKCSGSNGVDGNGCSPCSTNIAGCSSCDNIASCTGCNEAANYLGTPTSSTSCGCIDGTYSTGSSCPFCRDVITNCDRCTSATVCTRCVSGFFVNPLDSCSACSLGCTTCTSETFCSACNGGLFFQIDNIANTCICMDSYFLQGTSCVPCSDSLIGCEQCVNENNCTLCKEDEDFHLNSIINQCYCNSTLYYNFTSDTCEPCLDVLDNCDECANSTYCNLCATGYTEIYTFAPTISSCGQCSTLIDGCLVCETPTVCTECDTVSNFVSIATSCECAPVHYFIMGTCQPCSSFSPQCTACDLFGCTACAIDYFLNATSKLCQLCSSTTPQCTACDSSGCTACAVDYFLNATNRVCQLCTSFSPQCTACTPTGCSVCADDYVVQSTSCARLCSIQLCIDCFNSTTCMFCVIHSTLTADHTECNCNTGYFSDSTECVECSSVLTNCVECESALKCTACEDGFVVDLETDQCVAFESALKMASLLLFLVFAALSF